MTLPYEAYRAIVNTKKLLSEIFTNSKQHLNIFLWTLMLICGCLIMKR